jgi:hypothetical protein
MQTTSSRHTDPRAAYDFLWDEEKVWLVDAPITNMDIRDLVWYFDLPLHSERNGYSSVSSRQILENPDAYRDEWARMLEADLDYPIDIMHHRGRWIVLDGIYRLMKAYAFKRNSVEVRIIPASKFSEIAR